MTNWLSTEEQSAWRAWLDASRLLNERLSRELIEQHGISMADYEILVQLSESPDQRMRMNELAKRTLASRSRLSHQCDRMEKKGFLFREPCTDDGRGFWAVLTKEGLNKIVTAAPDHVDGVRRHLVNLLSHQDFLDLGTACRTVVDHLDSDGESSFRQ